MQVNFTCIIRNGVIRCNRGEREWRSIRSPIYFCFVRCRRHWRQSTRRISARQKRCSCRHSRTRRRRFCSRQKNDRKKRAPQSRRTLLIWYKSPDSVIQPARSCHCNSKCVRGCAHRSYSLKYGLPVRVRQPNNRFSVRRIRAS